MHTDAVPSLPSSPEQSPWLSLSCSSTPCLAPRQAKWHHGKSPWCGWGPIRVSQGQGEALRLLHFCSRDGCSCSCFSSIPWSYTLHQPLSILSHSPIRCCRMVHACSICSLSCPIVMLVLLSRNAAIHGSAWFARSTVLPGQGQETNSPYWEELSKRQKPLAVYQGQADVICSIKLGNKVVAWEQQ